jgi:hypothetical protein
MNAARAESTWRIAASTLACQRSMVVTIPGVPVVAPRSPPFGSFRIS